MSVLYFLLLIGVLVLIHELGHFAAAKLLDFRVERFSLGFGRPLLRVVAGETEYQLGVFPLGGYVRIAGEDPDERGDGDTRSFSAKPLWQRLIVVFAGPLANLALPLVIYFALFVGETELPAAVIGDVAKDSPAHAAGLQPGDRVVEIDGEEVRYWEDIETHVRESSGVELKFAVIRGKRRIERYIEPTEVIRKRSDGRVARAGVIGIVRAPFLPQVGVVDPASSAALAGLETGDIIIAVEGRRIESGRALTRAFAKSRPSSTRLTHVSYLRGREVIPGISVLHAGSTDIQGGRTSAARRSASDDNVPRSLGLVPADLIVSSVDKDSPAAAVGIVPGDAIVKVGDMWLEHWLDLTRTLRSTGTDAVTLTWIRHQSGEVTSATLTQERVRQRDEFGSDSEVLVFGAHNRQSVGRGETAAISNRFRYAVGKAIERTGETISVVGTAFWSIVRGKSPREELGGPITMYRAAAVTGERGIVSFLFLIALISISVALINLLPIPVLDGGHLLVFLIEGIRGEKLSRKGHARFAVAGYAVVGLFTILAVGNDLLRWFLS